MPLQCICSHSIQSYLQPNLAYQLRMHTLMYPLARMKNEHPEEDERCFT